MRLGRVLGAKIAPSWRPKFRKIDRKIHVKYDQKFDAFQVPVFTDFGGFLEGTRRHVGTNIEQKSMPTSKSDFLKKTWFSMGKTMILRDQGGEVGRRNR